MDEQQPPEPRNSVPAWAWIVLLLVVIFGVQYFYTRNLNAPPVVPLSQVVDLIKSEDVEHIEVIGDKLEVQLIETVTTVEVEGEEVEIDPDNPVISAIKETGVGFAETLDSLGLTEAQRQSFTLTIKDQSLQSTVISLLFTIGPFLLIIWLFTRGFRQIQGGGNSIFGFGRSRARNLNEGERPTVTFDDVAGVDEAKEEVQEVVQFLREPEKFVQVGARIPKGVLMVGPPGTGKTLLARAIAGEAGVPFFHISGSEFVEMFVGVGASRVRDLFNKAKEHAPAIVFVDEIDAVGRQRGAGLGGGHDEREQTLNQILVEMDGFSNETNVIVIAATNRADVLDPALLRPGRFDRKVIVDLPDVTGREAILKVHARGKPIASDVSFSDLARLTAGFSGADLENLINEAAIFAARHDKTTVSKVEFQDAFDRILIGPERKSRVISPEDKEVLAYHEAGHALVRFYLPYTDPVQKITIIPRGRAGGFVMSLPEDRLVQHTEFFDDEIASTLGGRASEEIFFGRVTTGASQDLRQATNIARNMVMQYGMSSSLGLRSYGQQSNNIFLGRQMGYNRDYSEDAAKMIDEEVKGILDKNYQRARDIIKENRAKLVRLVEVLQKVETLDRVEFEQVMNEEIGLMPAFGD